MTRLMVRRLIQSLQLAFWLWVLCLDLYLIYVVLIAQDKIDEIQAWDARAVKSA